MRQMCYNLVHLFEQATYHNSMRYAFYSITMCYRRHIGEKQIIFHNRIGLLVIFSVFAVSTFNSMHGTSSVHSLM